MDTRRMAGLAAIVACVLWGFYGYFSRNLIAEGLTATQVAGIRLFIAVIMMAVFITLYNTKLFRIRLKDLPVFILFAFIVLAENVLYNLAIEHVPLALAELLQMTSPYYVMIFAFFLFRDIPTVMKLVATAIALFGGVFVTGALTSGGSTDYIGYIYAVGSGVMLALCGIGMKGYSRKGYDPITLVFWTFFFAAAITVPMGTSAECFRTVFATPRNIGLVIGLGFIVTVAPYVMQAWAIGKMDVTVVSILSVSQCVFAALAGYLFFHEVLTWENVIGMIIVMASLIMMEMSDYIHDRKYPVSESDTLSG